MSLKQAVKLFKVWSGAIEAQVHFYKAAMMHGTSFMHNALSRIPTLAYVVVTQSLPIHFLQLRHKNLSLNFPSLLLPSFSSPSHLFRFMGKFPLDCIRSASFLVA